MGGTKSCGKFNFCVSHDVIILKTFPEAYSEDIFEEAVFYRLLSISLQLSASILTGDVTFALFLIVCGFCVVSVTSWEMCEELLKICRN